MYAQRELPKAHGSLAIALAKSPNSQSHSPRASQSHPRDPTSKWFGSSDWTVTMAKTWVRCGGLGRPVRYNMVQLRGEQQTTRWKWGLDIRLGVFAGIYIYICIYIYDYSWFYTNMCVHELVIDSKSSSLQFHKFRRCNVWKSAILRLVRIYDGFMERYMPWFCH